jgi:hypothetical protein
MLIEIAQIQTIPEVLAMAKIAALAIMAFVLAMAFTPLLAHFLYKYKIGIKIKNKDVDGGELSYVSKMHAHKSGTPRMDSKCMDKSFGYLKQKPNLASSVCFDFDCFTWVSG